MKDGYLKFEKTGVKCAGAYKSNGAGSESSRGALAIYGVYGMTDWEMLVPLGGGYIRVCFKGGSMTGYGIVPATFSTNDALLQLIIESSPQFADGRVKKLR